MNKQVLIHQHKPGPKSWYLIGAFEMQQLFRVAQAFNKPRVARTRPVQYQLSLYQDYKAIILYHQQLVQGL